MEITSFMAIKGGVGKTTLSFNYANWLANKGERVLLIDLDAQRSLTELFRIQDGNEIFSEEDEVTNGSRQMFLDKSTNVLPYSVAKNIDLIPADKDLNEHLIFSEIIQKPNKELLLFMWFLSHGQELDEKYDHVIIDLPPAWNLITMNGVSVADKVISPMEPGRFGFESHGKVRLAISEFRKSVVNPMTGKSYVRAKVLFLGNKIHHNRTSSRMFIDAVANFDDMLENIPEKELINRSTLERTGVFEFSKDPALMRKHKNFFEHLDHVFNLIENA